MRSRTLAAVLAIPVLACGLGACGDDDEKTERGAVSAVEDYLDAFNEGDYSDACEHFTDEYVDELMEEWNSDEGVGDARSCTGMLKQGAILVRAFSELEDDEAIYEVEEVSAKVDGDHATVDVSYQGEDTSRFGLVYDDGEWLIDEDLEDEGAEATGEGDDASASPQEQSSIGETVDLGDWTITVTAVEENADATIAQANEFNEKPKHQYVMFTYEATYNGDARTASVDSDLTWSFTTGDAKVIEVDDAVTPSQVQNWPVEVRTGGTARAQIVFDIDPAAYADGLLSVESYDDEYNEIYVDFAV